MESSRLVNVKPEVWQIFELVRDAADGKLRIPDFQRPFVWRREQMLELLDSIRKRYPIGSLLVWETEEEVSSKKNIGLVRIDKQGKGVTSLVLDGHQRISTLTGVLVEPPEDRRSEDDQDPERWKIWFNAKDNVFEHLRKGEQRAAWHFPMCKLMDTIAFLDECERMRKDGGPEGQRFVTNTQDLLRVFVDQQIPMVRIKNTALSQAVNIFARLNSTGKKISADQMAAAITYKEGSKTLADYIDQLADILNMHGLGRIDRVIILRAILACIGEDIYSTHWTRFDGSKKQDDLHSLQSKMASEIESIMNAMQQATEFLNKLGVKHCRLLPYAQQLVVISAFFKGCNDKGRNPTSDQLAFLERWFWVSSFTGWFAYGNPSRVSALINEMREQVAGNPMPKSLENMRMDEPAQPFPKDFDMRSARTKTWLLMMLSSRTPLDANGKSIDDPWKLIDEHVLSYVAATVRNKSLYSSPANRMLRLSSKDRSQAMNWLVKLEPNIADQVLESHGIRPDSLSMLRAGQRDDFLMERRDYLISIEMKFMESKGVTPPIDSTPSPAPIDTDDSTSDLD